MGLLEKALQYKKNINNMGEDTLIDRIKGPADTEIENEFLIDDEKKTAGVNSPENETIKVAVRKEDEVINDNSDLTTEKNSVSVNSSEDDDLFALPDIDDVMPVDELNTQKIHHETRLPEKNIIPMQNKLQEESDTFGAADEPVLTKTNLSEIKKQNQVIETKHSEIETRDNIKERRPVEIKEDNAGIDINNQEEISEDSTRFSDIIVLYEIEKDIINSESRENLFDIILFSIMGQIGVSSTSIMIPSGNGNKWVLAESRGVEIDQSGINFSSDEGILKKIIENNQITDIEDYNRDDFKDDYLKYISIDARMLVPMIKGDHTLGVIVLGNKITDDEYKDEDFEFIKSIAGLSGRVLHNLTQNEAYIKQIDILKKNSELILDTETFQEKILSFEKIEEIQSEIREYFLNLGIDSYSIFNRFENDAVYKPVVVEKEDFLLLKEIDFNIKLTSKFSRYVFNFGHVVDINDFKKAEIVRDVFSESQINKMSHLRIYPFSIAKKSCGFIALFRIRPSANLDDIDAKMTRISKFIFSYINNIRDINFKENKYIDNIEILYKRIDDEIINARSLGIPMTLVLFSIKNYKRYFNLYGVDEVKKLFESFEKIIKIRLGDGDFSVRYDSHKILIILPGKDKKFAVPLANSIRNELLSVYQKKEIQLLLTYLTAEYPEDGTNLYNLIDTID